MKFIILAPATIAFIAASAVAASAHPVAVTGAGTSVICNSEAQDPHADVSAAVQDCSEALRYEPMMTEIRAATLTNRGILRSRMNDKAGALDDYNEAISMDPNSAQAYLNRSATLLGLKRYGDAKNDADKALALHATPVEVAYFNRAAAEEGLGDVRAAYDDYKAALAAQPNFQPAANELKRFKVVSPGGAS